MSRELKMHYGGHLRVRMPCGSFRECFSGYPVCSAGLARKDDSSFTLDENKVTCKRCQRMLALPRVPEFL